MATIDEVRAFLEGRTRTVTARHGPAAARVIVLWELEELKADGSISEQDADILRDELEDIPFS